MITSYISLPSDTTLPVRQKSVLRGMRFPRGERELYHVTTSGVKTGHVIVTRHFTLRRVDILIEIFWN